MSKPIYKHPPFVINTDDKRIPSENKRLWLSLTIDNTAKESIIVILKNPSRASKDISDKTVYNVTSYIFKNRLNYTQLNNVGKVIILNLIPFYETYSAQLSVNGINILDKANFQIINDFTSTNKNVIVAWGDHPKGLFKEYEQIKTSVLDILKTNANSVFYIDKLSKQGNPKHGMVWGYDNKLLDFNL